MARRSFVQTRASIMLNESLHKIVDGVNYGVDIEKLCGLLESECKQTSVARSSDKILRCNK